MDRTRLDNSLVEMAAAEAAYDTALRRHADATERVTGNPVDRAAVRELQLASRALTQARTRVAAARVALDDIRAAELTALSTGDQLLASIPGNQVSACFRSASRRGSSLAACACGCGRMRSRRPRTIHASPRRSSTPRSSTGGLRSPPRARKPHWQHGAFSAIPSVPRGPRGQRDCSHRPIET